jgi:hypothetical protein
MRQIAQFMSVLACALFAGASVYVNFVEHPARMRCGVEIAATEFPPSYRRGTVMQADTGGFGAGGVRRGVVRWGEHLVAGRGSSLGFSHSVHPGRDLANQQAIAQSNTGQTFNRSGASPCPLEHSARGSERA